ncbi:hypothetical protein [uncultured Campylobacter sp.]|uniref:hypothetical protein n=1 Tax=uncultured Campylobacter sp. TaxID=218934 RepID=UPI002604BC42|nr:hypothetical protein [uncultured Campylobacter sp.]
MKYYKNSQGEVYAYDDDVSEDQIKEGLTKITEAQAKSMLEPSLEELKAAKTAELASWVNAMGESCKVEIKDFGAVNGGYKYLLNIGSMIDTFDSLEVRGFRMYDNTMKKINGQEDLKKIKRAIQIAGQKLHVLKWGYETAIEKAKTSKALEAIKFADTIEV